jgi:hypothetical protein
LWLLLVALSPVTTAAAADLYGDREREREERRLRSDFAGV